jgi:membrane carboxypeptidase/penicillin-binding protein
MRLIGKLISLIACVVLSKRWSEVKLDLILIHTKYCYTIREQIPPNLVSTLIVAEDHRFFRHRGVDLIAVLRAIRRNIISRKHEGASTIEQQLVRTITCRYERTFRRKITEIFLASLIETVIPKKDIPGIYLSLAYFGWKMNGVKQACLRLDFALTNLSLFQSSLIIARLKYPEPKNPTLLRKQQIYNRSRHILNLLTKETTLFSAYMKEVGLNGTISDI